MIENAAQTAYKDVSDPCAVYNSLKPLWTKNRVICNGEQAVKDYDSFCDTRTFSNLLLPFSASMDQTQYNFFKSEAELPGITAQFARMLVGALLRKEPTLRLPEGTPPEVTDWILDEFGQDDNTLLSFLDDLLWEEIQTNRTWIKVDYPAIEHPELLSKADSDRIKPYPVVLKAESVINWHVGQNSMAKNQLEMLIERGYQEVYDNDKYRFHPRIVEVVTVHALDEQGYYYTEKWAAKSQTATLPVSSGQQLINYKRDRQTFELIEVNENILMNGERLRFIPIWPVNGCIEPEAPLLNTLVSKEIHLYNKISRRNHLLYGASTYTPYVSGNGITEEVLEEIANAGLGSWLRVPDGATIEILKTPTEALADMDRAIAAAIEEMAKLGVRMLSPETAQSGVALTLRNASQTAQLGSMNNRISSTMRSVIAFMINWRYGQEFQASDVTFTMSDDFNVSPLGAEWVRMATEWYQQYLIPRSAWLNTLKANDMLPAGYDDNVGRMEIAADQMLAMQMMQDPSTLAAMMAGDEGGTPGVDEEGITPEE